MRMCATFALAMGLGITVTPTPAGAAPEPEVRLVLQLTVDGLRGDLLDRYRNGLGPDGFRREAENDPPQHDRNGRGH